MDTVERGRKLKEMREAAGYKQRQVGAWFDIDGRAVSEWERGKSNPDRRKLVRLDEAYGAQGEILAMFEVAPAVSSLDVALRETEARLRSEIDAVDARLRAMEESLRAQLETMVAPLEALADRLERERRES